MLAFSDVTSSSSTYTAAQAIVAAIEAGQIWEDAFIQLSAFSGPELAEVSKKALALGADPAIMSMLLEAVQPGELIHVTSTAPVVAKPIPWFWIALLALVIGGGVYYFRKRK